MRARSTWLVWSLLLGGCGDGEGGAAGSSAQGGSGPTAGVSAGATGGASQAGTAGSASGAAGGVTGVGGGAGAGFGAEGGVAGAPVGGVAGVGGQPFGGTAGVGGLAAAGGVAGSAGVATGGAATGGAGGVVCPAVPPPLGSGAGLIYFQDAEQSGGCSAETPPFDDWLGVTAPDCDHNDAPAELSGEQTILFAGSRSLSCANCFPAEEPELFVELEVLRAEFPAQRFSDGWRVFTPVAGDRDEMTGAEVFLDGDVFRLRCSDGTQSMAIVAPGAFQSLTYNYSWKSNTGTLWARKLDHGFPSGQRVDFRTDIVCPCGPAPTGFVSISKGTTATQRAQLDDVRVTRSLSELDEAIASGM